MTVRSLVRRRARQPATLALTALALALFWVLSLGVAYRTGTSEQETRVAELEAELELQGRLVQDLSRRAAQAEQDVTRVQRQRGPTESAEPTLAVGRNELEALGALIDQRLRAGVTIEQLSKALGSATPAAGANCAGAPEVRQFLARTPVTRDPSMARFDGGRIIVAGSGVSVRNPQNGRPEAWFDAGRPVALRFEVAGAASSAEGMLPLQHTVRHDGKEYRFAMSPHTRRGVIQVALTVCDGA